MIKCPNCKHEEPYGTLFCSRCGARLVPNDTENTKNRKSGSQIPNFEDTNVLDRPVPPIDLLDYPALLFIVSSNVYIPIEEDNDLTLGRVSKDQPLVPDIDLTPYNAYEEGVSRLHASIKFSNGNCIITDLGSVNGTKINGKRIISNQAMNLSDGDMISLGQFKMLVIINN